MEKSDSLKNRDQKLLHDELFIVFGEDFARHPHALEHLLRPLFETNTFIWVETIGLRSPSFSLYDLKRIREKLKRWFLPSPQEKDSREIPKTVHVVSPFMIPFNQFKIIRFFNRYQVKKSVQQALQHMEKKKPITVASVPNAADYVGDFDEELKVYFCVDEFSLWPGLNYTLVRQLEEELIKRVDLILATAENLALNKKKSHDETRVITHGVEFEHFNIGPKTESSLPYKLCYFGLFDERSNQDILTAIAALENVEIHIFGNVVCDVKALKTFTNIIFHGPVKYGQLPKKIKDMDAFILPYVKNDLTQYINPLKLKEYLSTGRPVIATDLPEILKLKEHLFVARNESDFKKIIESLLLGQLQFNRESVIDYVKKNETWQAKAKLFSTYITEALKRSR